MVDKHYLKPAIPGFTWNIEIVLTAGRTDHFMLQGIGLTRSPFFPSLFFLSPSFRRVVFSLLLNAHGHIMLRPVLSVLKVI